MKRVLKWIGGLAALLVLATAVVLVKTAIKDPEPPPPPAPISLLSIDTDPPGAQISVDAKRRGTAPLKLEGLEVGVHEIVAATIKYADDRDVRGAPGL